MPVLLSVEVDDRINDDLNRLSEATGRSTAELQQMALAWFVEEELGHVESILAGRRDADAGLVVSHEDVVAWMDSLGTDHPLPRPQPRAVEVRRAS